MDNAVALVRSYLQLNGYFTITEYPVVRKLDNGGFRTLTEIDVAAFHLPRGEPDFAFDARYIHRRSSSANFKLQLANGRTQPATGGCL